MKHTLLLLLALSLTCAAAPAPNTLTDSEKSAGWRLLWDGKTTAGWRKPKSDTFPDKAWLIKDGVLTVIGKNGNPGAGSDIITRDRYSDFELTLDFKMTPRANSGIKIFTQLDLDPATGKNTGTTKGSVLGLEYQILDDALHPDAKAGHDGNRKLAGLYDILPPNPAKKTNPIGEWNTARIISRGAHVEHWLNGEKVLEYDRGSPAFRAGVARSKFNEIPAFGEWPEGHILLQDHGDEVSFRNIKIRILKK